MDNKYLFLIRFSSSTLLLATLQYFALGLEAIMDRAVSLLSGLEAKRYATWVVFIAIAYQLKTFYPVILGLVRQSYCFLHVARILSSWELRFESSTLGRLFSATLGVMLWVFFLSTTTPLFSFLFELYILPPSNAYTVQPFFFNFLFMHSPAHYSNALTQLSTSEMQTTTHAQISPFTIALHFWVT